MKNLLFKLVLVSIPVIAMISCQKRIETESKPELVELIVESRLYSPPEEQKFLLEEVLPEFEKANNCIVKFETMDDDSLLKKAQFQKESGKVTTDVVIVHDGIMNDWIRSEYVMPLPVDEWTDRSFSNAFGYRISSGGKTYFAPIGGRCVSYPD